jgi:hypothetical protein
MHTLNPQIRNQQKRVLFPPWTRWSYVSETEDDLPDSIGMYTRHYYVLRHSLLLIMTALLALSVGAICFCVNDKSLVCVCAVDILQRSRFSRAPFISPASPHSSGGGGATATGASRRRRHRWL